MNKKLFSLVMILYLTLSCKAQVTYGDDEKYYVAGIGNDVVTPHVEKSSKNFIENHNSYHLSGLKDNWVISIKGGFSSFIGTPNSHTDFYGRTKTDLNISLGKWHTPFFGTRFVYQGMRFIDASLTDKGYASYHGDLLFNVSSLTRSSFEELPKWDLIPYIGAGVLSNTSAHNNPFAFSYGVIIAYRFPKRIHVSLDLGSTVTSKNFDTWHHGHGLDQLAGANLGISVSLGKLGWNKKTSKISNSNYDFNSEYPYITNLTPHPNNNYSGINKLHRRIANKNTNDKKEENNDFSTPVLFFFQRNSTKLIDIQQLVNIGEIAGSIKLNNLNVRIMGAADSKTGSPNHNRHLSIRRAKYIARILIKAGVPKSRMKGYSEGGINTYRPYTANRHTCIILYKGNASEENN